MAKYTPEELTAAKKWASDYTKGYVYILLAALEAAEKERDRKGDLLETTRKERNAWMEEANNLTTYISALEKAGDGMREAPWGTWLDRIKSWDAAREAKP